MPTYYDSSVVVALVSNEPRSARALELWAASPERVGSILLAIESEVALRRLAVVRPSLAKEASERLASLLGEVALKHVDDDVLRVVRSTPALARCRSLDAVHLATAIHFAGLSDEPTVLVTFDARMAEVAARVGLKVSGADVVK
jgi:predicted nucleic acid-binding protein